MQANHSVVPGLDPASTAHAIRAAIGDEVDLMLDVGLIGTPRPRSSAPVCRGLPVINHNFMTDINVAASLHFLASVPNAFIMEYPVEPSEIGRRWRRARFPSSTAMRPCPRSGGSALGPIR
jgi:L-alanine-DL-glutamate epimerase-like enolase superfamily enzyme